MDSVLKFKSQKPKTQTSKKMSIDLSVGGENDEVQKHTDGNDVGSFETDTSASR